MSIKAVDLTYTYGAGTAFEQRALRGVNFEIKDGEFVGLIGHTGSGKSTLIQHLNGLLKATGGDILYHGESIYQEGYNLRALRGKVGLVFQYPEYQLFETAQHGRTAPSCSLFPGHTFRAARMLQQFLTLHPFLLCTADPDFAAYSDRYLLSAPPLPAPGIAIPEGPDHIFDLLVVKTGM